MKLSEIRQGLQSRNREGILKGMSWDAIEILRELEILQNPNISPMRALDTLLKHKDTNDSVHGIATSTYNTYPFGVPGILQPRLLAVCRGKMTLRGFLEEVLARSKRMLQTFPNEKKTVIILTDKWDATIFRKYEKIFLNYALQYEVCYIILLVTDYGITDIPFLPRDNEVLNKMKGCIIEDDEDEDILNDIIRILDGKPIEFFITENALYNDDRVCFNFYLETMKWERIDNRGKVEGDIPPDDLRKFVESIRNIMERKRKFITTKSKIADAPMCTLKIAEKTVEWNAEYTNLTNDKFFIDLERNIYDFIWSCEKY